MRQPLMITVAALALAATTVPLSAHAAHASVAVQSPYWHIKSVQIRTHQQQVGTKEKYWVVQQEASETWTDRDGRRWHAYRSLGVRPKSAADLAAWKRDGSPQQWSYRTEGMLLKLSATPGKAVVRKIKGTGWSIGERMLSYQDIQTLPTAPKELEKWLAKASTEGDDPVRPEHFGIWVKGAYQSLLHEIPAPKSVRTAAYKALSGMPGVRRSSQGKDVERLTYTEKDAKGGATFSADVDTAAMTLKRTTLATTYNGKPLPAKTWTTEHSARWTDTRPPAVS